MIDLKAINSSTIQNLIRFAILSLNRYKCLRMKTSTVALGLWFAIASFEALAGTVPATNSTASVVPQRSMLTMGGIVTTPERKASPLFSGNELPPPPRQKDKWATPMSSLPTNYVSATALLFEQGLANPRDCDYREIEVGTGSPWSGDGGVVNTHGWLLPNQGGQQFAVCWNGLVYPTAGVGTNADLEADVAQIETNGLATWYSAIPEAMSVSQVGLLGVKGCLLLRLGRVDLATRYWQAQVRREQEYREAMWSRGAASSSSTNGVKLPDADPYLGWATEWTWAMFDRMICAHMRGDEKLALLTARELAQAQPQIEAECAKRGFKRQPELSFSSEEKLRPYLDFLAQLPQLLADLERRAIEGPHIGVLSRGATNIIDQMERVTALVRDLDLASARQWGQPGWVNLPEDPVVTALIQEGDAAVEPLLDCLEHDQRLTRSVGFGRDFHRDRTVIPVSSAASVALQSILQAGFSSVSEMRAYWSKYKNLKLEDRWYALLNDDSARDRWQEAASRIVQPENVTTFPGGFSMERPAPTNTAIRLRGERLRERTSPSVSELLARRALEVPTNNVGSYDLSASCQMAEYLAQWDAEAALPVAKTLSKRASTVMKYSGQQLGGHLTKLSLARAKARDSQAFDDYADWIVTTKPDQFEQSTLDCLEPLRRFSTNAVLQAAAEKLFSQTNSTWGSLPWKSTFGRPTVESDLVAIPAYRTLLGRELEKTNVCGTITSERPGYLGYSLTDLHQGGSFGITLPDNSAATNGSTATVRWCDWIAVALANGKHIAPFDPFASTENRDETIKEAISHLRGHEK